MPKTLLIIEDENLLAAELERHYRRQDWEVLRTDDLAGAADLLFEQGMEPLVVLSDMSLPDGNGLDLLERVRSRGLTSEWIFLTGYGTIPDSVRAMQLGAFDFITKPCDQQHLDLIVNGAARSARAQQRLNDESRARTKRYAPESFVGRSSAARTVREMLCKLTEVPFSALIISGETGTGKGLAARILHHAAERAGYPLVEINCAALPRDLLESELFGHEAGAFTGARGRHRGLMEQANGGTLFLDEIGEMDLDLQVKLLKAIEDRTIRRLGGDREIPIDVQILAATNRDLMQSVREGSFRADLYHRLSVFRLELPPLRDRKEDLQDLTPIFVEEFNAKAGKRVRHIHDEVITRLMSHTWPGNVRELRNVVERCVLFSTDETFPGNWLQLGPRLSEPSIAFQDEERVWLPLDGTMTLEDMERHILETALKRHQYNVTATARALATTRETLRYRVNKYRLKPMEQ
ncbi:MAG: sigma-54 dependent transcriptional regulator [Gammaproteobacteria bacterium]